MQKFSAQPVFFRHVYFSINNRLIDIFAKNSIEMRKLAKFAIVLEVLNLEIFDYIYWNFGQQSEIPGNPASTTIFMFT